MAKLIQCFRFKNKIKEKKKKKKKIRDTKGTFHAKMGSTKDRNGMDLIEAEDIKKRWQEYTELYKKDLHDPDNHDGVITDLEPDILECEVKWALERSSSSNEYVINACVVTDRMLKARDSVAEKRGEISALRKHIF